ncbi:MAG TPA: glucose-6-phosphate dehydrogenase assembly protein OpcA [Jiangellaceae bacterium]
MIIDMPSTDAHRVARRMVQLREEHGAVAIGRVLTLIVVVDEEHAEHALDCVITASHEHPSRMIAVVRSTARGAPRLDAQIRIGGDAGAGEIIIARTFGPLTGHPASVVTPLMLPDAPIVAWWPAEAPENPSEDPVGRLAQRRITDALTARRPANAIRDRAAHYTPGDTDMAWTRLTKWRALLAAALDQPPHEEVTKARVVAESTHPSGDLMAAWLALALDCPVTRAKSSKANALVSVRLDRPSGPIVIDRPGEDVATLTTPGYAERRIALPRRTIAECLAEELRRLDPDDVYGEVLTTGMDLLREKGRTTRASAA